MCILFFVANPKPIANGYKLILVNNRDEFYFRPTKDCHFWEKQLDTIGGMDMEPGKEGGTWLAMNKNGKIGVLLNILQPTNIDLSNKLGRGFLVPNFLSSTIAGAEYLNGISMRAADYSPFNMVTIELKDQDISIGHFSSLATNESLNLPIDEHGIGNSPPDHPWQKVIYGKQRFSEIISKYSTTETIEELVNELMLLLNDEKSCYPDPQLQKQCQGRPDEYVKHLSSMFVRMPKIKYGTRTNSIILVDSNEQVTFIERTMQSPVDPEFPLWVTKRHNFQLVN